MDDTDAQASGVWPELMLVAQPARDRRRLSPETRSQIILDLCTRAPLSVKELSELLDRSEAYIGDAIRPLVTAGDLTFLFPDQPRHPRQKYLTAPAPAVVHEVPAPPMRPATAPRAANEPVPAPLPAPEIVRRSKRLKPNQWTNGLTVLIVGVVLSQWQVFMWPIVATLVGLMLAMLHIYTNSPQYQRFRELHSTNRARRRTSFVLLKTGVALVEIAIVHFAATVVIHVQ